MNCLGSFLLIFVIVRRREVFDRLCIAYRSLTFGKAIQVAKKDSLYPDTLLNDLTGFLEKRNWLVHKCVPYNIDDMHEVSARDKLFCRIKDIANKAKTLQQAVEADLMSFSELMGMDMSRVRAEIEQYYREA
jgi:hypothetical protein